MSVIMEEASRAGLSPIIGYWEPTEEDLRRVEQDVREFEAKFLIKKPKAQTEV